MYNPERDRKRICKQLRRALNKHVVVDFAAEKGIGSTTLYAATNEKDGNPSLHTLLRITRALGLELWVKPAP